MAILKIGGDEVEVRIKRYPDGTYFDEHVKVEEREKPWERECTRYIVGEDGVTYTIEFTLRKGFSFDGYNIVKPIDCDGIIKDDVTRELGYANVTVSGKKMLGTRFAFKSLHPDQGLQKSTDVLGIDPKTLGFFRVSIVKCRQLTKFLSQAEYDKKVARAEERKQKKTQSQPWDASKVDEDSFAKDGITCAIGFVGGRPEHRHAGFYQSVRNYTDTYVLGPEMKFFYYHRSADFIERIGIVPYPPPLYLYAWEHLNESERKMALRELQIINKEHVHRALQAKGGFTRTRAKLSKDNEPKEWRAWSKMYVGERQSAFDTLKKAKRDYDRGEVQRQFESNRGDVVTLVDDQPEEKVKLQSEKRNHSDLVPDDGVDLAAKAKVLEEIKNGTRSGNTAFDLLTPPASKKVKRERNIISIEDDDVETDENLESIKEKARLLAEDIAAEERLLKMRREQRALQEKIDSAQTARARGK